MTHQRKNHPLPKLPSAYPTHQHTIAKTVSVTNIGLHSGQPVTLTLQPAKPNHGIVFVRTDLSDRPYLPAHASLITSTHLSSNLQKDGVQIATVEHLLSALAGMCVDNVLIEVSSAEVPIMDGSAADYVRLIEQAGKMKQNMPRRYLRLTNTIEVHDDDKWASLSPYDGYRLDFEIDFAHPVVNQSIQTASIEMTQGNYRSQISLARTFGFAKDIAYLQQNNLALGGNLDNAIVVDDDKILNPTGLRLADEFVKHKILDAIGDLSLMGYPLLAHYQAFKSGHGLNNQLAKAVLNEPNCFEIVTIYDIHKN